MHCPTLVELPAPPPGRTGWPWTVEVPQLLRTMPDFMPWPRISIVTPSYNQAEFIEETIRSILLQGYPDLEYVIMDGGSTDGASQIAEKYKPWLHHFESARDGGQPDAIIRGVDHSTGKIVHWINSDDVLMPGALKAVALASKGGRASVASGVENFSGYSSKIVRNRRIDVKSFLSGKCIYHQPGLWMTREAWRNKSAFNGRLHYCFDALFMLQAVNAGEPVVYIDDTTVRFRLHPASKTVSVAGRFQKETRAYLRALKYDRNFAHHHPAISQWLRKLALYRIVSIRRRRGIHADFLRAIAQLLISFPDVSSGRFVGGALRRAVMPVKGVTR